MKHVAVLLMIAMLFTLPAFAADKPFEQKFSAKPDQVFAAATVALDKLKWRTQLANKKALLIMFNTGEWELSGKSRCTATVEEAEGGSLVQLAVNRKYAVGFAKNDRLVKKFFDAVQEELKAQTAAAEVK